MNNQITDQNILSKKLSYLSYYRGSKEADLVVHNLYKRVVAANDTKNLSLLESFLSESDTLIWSYLKNEKELPTHYLSLKQYCKLD